MNRTLRLALPLAVLAVLLAAIGYWNIRPENFMERRSAAPGENAIDFYVENRPQRTVPGGSTAPCTTG